MPHRYAVIGSGRQGTAAAYDFGKLGEAEVIWVTDIDLAQAERAAIRVNDLLGRPVARAAALDAGDPHAVAGFLRKERIKAFLSGVPYFYNLGLTEAAIQAGSGMTDLGGNSEVVIRQLALSGEAESAGCSIVPDCGQVPGMGTSLVLLAMELLDQAEDVYMWDGGLPEKPVPPWNYTLHFSIEGLTNEYFGDCLYIRDGKTVGVPSLEELETVEFPPPLGRLEAFTTAGGLTTAARTFAGKLRTLQNKTLRYPGHYQQLKVIQQLGLLDPRPMDVDGQRIAPRQLLHALWDPQIRAAPETRDVIIIRVVARGTRGGRPAETQVDLIHGYDSRTGFNAMEQGTGWHAAILTEAIADGRVTPGVVPVESAMTGRAFAEEARKRGFEIQVEERAA